MIPDYMKGMRIAISYVRWSTPQQKLGDSKRRQVDRTLQFCNENNLYLDQQLVGSGLSAYSGKHRREGTDLARFLQELKDGKVPKGAVLIIESLDRLTRQKIAEALELFLSIIRAGVEIVTLIDKQWYTPETLGEIQNLLVIIGDDARCHITLPPRQMPGLCRCQICPPPSPELGRSQPFHTCENRTLTTKNDLCVFCCTAADCGRGVSANGGAE
jgi:hypothetical protein